MTERKIIYLRSKFEPADEAKKRDKKIGQVAKTLKTSWAGAVRHMVDSYPTEGK